MRRLTPLPDAIKRVAAAAAPSRHTCEGKRSQRRRAQRLQLARKLALRVGPPAILCAGLATSGVWAWESGVVTRQSAKFMTAVERDTAELGLTVHEVLVTGRERTDREAILAALDVAYGGPMLAISPDAARKRLEALPWVKRAVVERQLPNRIYVRLRERHPMALWQLQGRLSVIDTDGERIANVEPAAHAKLPLVVGPGAPGHTARLLQILQTEPDLAKRMRAAVRVSQRRWNVRLDNGVDVQLPEENLAKAWSQLARVERKHGVLQRDVRMIDLRLPDRMVVRMGPDSEPMEPAPAPGPGEST